MCKSICALDCIYVCVCMLVYIYGVHICMYAYAYIYMSIHNFISVCERCM